jgi:hypothetical protein
MPLPPIDCNEPEQPCCETLFGIGEHLLGVVLPGLLECIGEPACPVDDLYAYVTHGPVSEDPLCNSLTVTLNSINPSPGSSTPQATTLIAPALRAEYVIRLRESGFPTAYDDGDTIYAPDPQHIHHASRFSYAHGERMFRDILIAHSRRELAPCSCQVVQIGTFTPLPASGGCVGWEIAIVLDVPRSLPLGGP